MASQILFIDDDAAPLSTLERNLKLNYEIQTAEGAQRALEIVEKSKAFSVVVVDMQMPRINGLQTIELLRSKLHEAVFVMLTGNQDVTTAINAINEGRVFRFLNKPCQIAELSAAIDAGQKQHDLLIGEKELLSGTFTGAINLMIDLIEKSEARIIDTNRIAEAVLTLSSRIGVEQGWEEKIAARVCMLGSTLLGPEEWNQFNDSEPSSAEHQAIFKKICNYSASMLIRIPRLKPIADLLRLIPLAEGYNHESPPEKVIAALLRVAFYWNFITSKGLSGDVARSSIERMMPHLKSKVLEAMESLPDNHDSLTVSKVATRLLVPGMVCSKNFTLMDGSQIVSRGRKLTPAMIENICRTPELANQTLNVFDNSIPRSAKHLS